MTIAGLFYMHTLSAPRAHRRFTNAFFFLPTMLTLIDLPQIGLVVLVATHMSSYTLPPFLAICLYCWGLEVDGARLRLCGNMSVFRFCAETKRQN
jgi:hypothetical protein